MDEAQLIRFVAGPDASVVPDLARRLPGRGLWVAADRVSIQTAARKGLFARAAKRPLKADALLADQVEALILGRMLAALGMARKAGELISGFEKVQGAVVSGGAAFLIEATDGAEDGRRKMLAAMYRAQKSPRLIGLFNSDELGLALGGENVIHTAFLAGRGSTHWALDVERVSGFRPLFPESWGIGRESFERPGP